MHLINRLATALLALLLVACSSIETRPSDTAEFEAAGFRYFKWRTEPLTNPNNSSDPMYAMDPILRREVNSALAAKGYVLDAERAQFSVGYLSAMGLRTGVDSQDTSNISPIPSARPNRQINQAVVDNAQALSGVKETNNILIQFNDVANNTEIWRVVITKIVDNTNQIDVSRMESNLQKGVRQGLKPLPEAR